MTTKWFWTIRGDADTKWVPKLCTYQLYLFLIINNRAVFTWLSENQNQSKYTSQPKGVVKPKPNQFLNSQLLSTVKWKPLYHLLSSRLFVWVFVYLRGGGGRGEFGNVLTGRLRPNNNLIALYLVYLFGQLIQCTLSLYLPFENGTPFTYLLKKTEFTYNLCRHNVRLAHWFHHTRFRRTGERVRCMICCVFCSSNYMFGMNLMMDTTGA